MVTMPFNAQKNLNQTSFWPTQACQNWLALSFAKNSVMDPEFRKTPIMLVG
jgi:hypothetical protein